MKQAAWTVGPHLITSYGNGLSYLITAPDGREVFLQGDDASAWRAEYDAADDSEAGAESFVAETINIYSEAC